MNLRLTRGVSTKTLHAALHWVLRRGALNSKGL